MKVTVKLRIVQKKLCDFLMLHLKQMPYRFYNTSVFYEQKLLADKAKIPQ